MLHDLSCAASAPPPPSPFSRGSCGLSTVHLEHVLPRQVLPSSHRSSGRVALSHAQLLQQPSQVLPKPDPSCRIVSFHARSVGLKTVYDTSE